MTKELKDSTAKLMEFLKERYVELDGDGELEISPSLLASKVLDTIDPNRASPILVTIAASLQLRQLARTVCRETQNERELQAANASLFDDQLQPRYPARRNGEEVYVPRHHLTFDERQWNIMRLRREASSKGKHADALQSETDRLVATGALKAAA